MHGTEPPLLEFPVEYTIKVLGRDTADFVEVVTATVSEYAPDLGPADLRTSSKGRFVSVNITFTAQSLEQLGSIHEALNACDQVAMIL
jgi:putative lipoic acid-binding regulatory protein